MVFVTGGTGLVGSHIICELLARGRHVKALTRPSSDRTSFERTAKWLLGENYDQRIGNLTWCEGSLDDIIVLSEHMADCDEVYHAAAVVSFSRQDRDDLVRTNVYGTQNVFNACLSFENKPNVCFISSTATIGKVEKKIVDEEVPFSREGSGSFYSDTKYLAELEAFRAREEGLNVAIINPSIVLGYGNWNRGSAGFFRNGFNGFRFYTTGSNAFVDARDVARAGVDLVEKEIFYGKYLCTAWNKPFVEVFEAISRHFETRKPDIEVKPWMAEIAWRLAGISAVFTGRRLITRESARSGMRNSLYSSERLIEALDFEFSDFEQSIAEICQAYQQEQ